MADEESPLIKALPPASDYITYLTVIEYNLTTENLPVLHKVLQDATLTTNIGWDLVHLLVPLLPASEQCLQDIARLGNPREVILKVTESLRLIDFEGLEPNSDEEDTVPGANLEHSTRPIKTAVVEAGPSKRSSTQAVELPPPLPLPVSQFIALLSMLATLQPRIKTKHPSRFLSTTLQAILASFSHSVSHREELVMAVVRTVKVVTGIRRPSLPRRTTSGTIAKATADVQTVQQPVADPEAEASVDSTPGESDMQQRLLQAFVTHVLEEYMLPLSGQDDVPGLAWCSRMMEKLHPKRIVPKKTTLADRFASEDPLQARIDAVGQLVALAQDLQIEDEDLLATITTEQAAPEPTGEEDEPPASAKDIPLSRTGSLFLYTARTVSNVLYDNPTQSSVRFRIFPEQGAVLKHCLSSPEQGTGTLGTEPESLIDAVVALGIVCLEEDRIGNPSDDAFNEYLQVTALLSSNCPSPNLRGHAHYLTSTVLRSQPSDTATLAFIKDTLEHCPFENLKVSAIGWIKGETIEANPMQHGHGDGFPEYSEPTVFSTPIALDSVAPFIWSSLQADLAMSPLQEAWAEFNRNFSVYLAALNFLYLLLRARHLHEPLGIKDMYGDNDIAGSFLQPLREASLRFRKEMEEGGGLADVKDGETMAQLKLLDGTLEAVTDAVKMLN